MDKINEVINFFKTMQWKQIVDFWIAIGIVCFFLVASSFFSYSILKLLNPKKKKEGIKKHIFYRPLKFFFIVLGGYLATLILPLPIELTGMITKWFKILTIILIANGFANSMNPKFEFSARLQAKLKWNGDSTVSNFVSKIVKAIVYLIAGFLIASELGYDLNGLIAGLGLGGVVIAFAAQDFAKNLFGGFTILMDKPFLVGDWIEVGQYSGTVEDLSFRSTKIRTAEDSIITIPNSVLSNEYIINWNRMSKRRYAFDLAIDRTCSLDKIRQVIDKIEFVLKQNPHLEKDTVQVHMDKITQEAINLFISVYTPVTAYYEYLAVKQMVNSSVLEILEKEEVLLAYPTRMVQLRK